MLGTVVQSWVSADPGLKFNLLFKFLYFCTSVHFKTSETKTTIHSDKISEKYFQVYKQDVGKFLLNFTVKTTAPKV